MLVFVYGTLRKGHANHGLLEKSLFICDASTRGLLYHLPQGFPAMVEGDGLVSGEVYEVDDSTLKQIDILEDYYGEGQNNLYNRVKLTVNFTNGTSALVNVYLYSNTKEAVEKGKLIDDGDWTRFIKTL